MLFMTASHPIKQDYHKDCSVIHDEKNTETIQHCV